MNIEILLNRLIKRIIITLVIFTRIEIYQWKFTGTYPRNHIRLESAILALISLKGGGRGLKLQNFPAVTPSCFVLRTYSFISAFIFLNTVFIVKGEVLVEGSIAKVHLYSYVIFLKLSNTIEMR